MKPATRRIVVSLLAAAAVATGAGVATPAELVSVSSQGNQANEHSLGASLSPDGRYVLFGSLASNLVAGDRNGTYDVFLRDRRTGTTERVSVGAGGIDAYGPSWPGGLSADGRVAGFASLARNLVEGDDNGRCDVFLRDRLTGTTERISRGDGGSDLWFCGDSAPSLSEDGRLVVFCSDADDLVEGDGNGKADVFAYDRQTGAMERVSVGPEGSETDDRSWGPAVSADGRFVLFTSAASNLVPDDSNGSFDVFVRDRLAATTERVSVSSAGAQAVHGGLYGVLSADGRWAVFSSGSDNLVDDDTNGVPDVFVRDLWSGTTERVSVSSEGTQANSGCVATAVSANGRMVAFFSYAVNLVSGDTAECTQWYTGFMYNCSDAFVRDRATGTTVMVSVASDGRPGNGDSRGAGLSADGRFAAIESDATNLVPGDANHNTDIFLSSTSPLAPVGPPRRPRGRMRGATD